MISRLTCGKFTANFGLDRGDVRTLLTTTAGSEWNIAEIKPYFANGTPRVNEGAVKVDSISISGCSSDINSTEYSKRSAARKKCVIKTLEGNTCPFSIIDTSNGKTLEAPAFEFHNRNTVAEFNSLIVNASNLWGVDPDLMRAIMYMETTHGWYDELPAFAADVLKDVNEKAGEKFEKKAHKSVLPMNVNYVYWGDFFGTREQLKNPNFNILQGAKMLAILEKHLEDNYSVAKIATLYNNHAALQVNEYGIRVRSIYQTQPWRKPHSKVDWRPPHKAY